MLPSALNAPSSRATPNIIFYDRRRRDSSVYRSKEQLARINLRDDTPGAPNVCGVRPAQAEDDLGAAVLARANDSCLVIVIVGGPSKVNHLHIMTRTNISKVTTKFFQQGIHFILEDRGSGLPSLSSTSSLSTKSIFSTLRSNQEHVAAAHTCKKGKTNTTCTQAGAAEVLLRFQKNFRCTYRCVSIERNVKIPKRQEVACMKKNCNRRIFRIWT